MEYRSTHPSGFALGICASILHTNLGSWSITITHALHTLYYIVQYKNFYNSEFTGQGAGLENIEYCHVIIMGKNKSNQIISVVFDFPQHVCLSLVCNADGCWTLLPWFPINLNWYMLLNHNLINEGGGREGI